MFLCAHLLRKDKTRNKIRGRKKNTKEVKRGLQEIEQKRKEGRGQCGTSREREKDKKRDRDKDRNRVKERGRDKEIKR